MFNPYTIILSLFVVTGLLATVWGWRILARARKTQNWPSVEGLIEESVVNDNDLLPRIVYSYRIGDQSHKRPMEFSGDITPSQEFAGSYVAKYPVGTRVKVFYDPEKPEVTTLEPGAGKGDWLVLVIGLTMLIFGLIFLAAGT